MKNKNKGKIEYVEEFRKITALEKLPTLKEGFGDLFFENKAENNKFLRLKDEPFLNEIELNSRLHQLCENDYVNEFVNDAESRCRQNIDESIVYLNEEVTFYKEWAKNLTDFVEESKYVYNFKSHKASPPVALSKEMVVFDPLAMELANDPTNKKNKNKQNETQGENASISSLPSKQKKRFNFSEITDYLITDDYKLEDLDGYIDLAKREIENFRPFKTIDQINQIQELKTDYEKFEYNAVEITNNYVEKRVKNNESSADLMNNLSVKHNNSSFIEEEIPKENVKKKTEIPLPEILLPSKNHYQKFKHLSIIKNVLDVNISYFRNLGPPARHPEDFIRAIVLEENIEHILPEEENPLTREKIDTCLLHFLEPTELKVNKNTLNFYDIENISMSRVVSTNAHMCIRSEKVTRLQYDKLVKKMEKLYKMQHEDGKTRVNQAVSTDEFEDEAGNPKAKNDGTQKKLSLQKIVEEINSIRKEAYGLQNADEEDRPYTFINERLVQDEMSRKMFSLLEELYQRVCEELPFNYSILEIGLHVDEVNGLAESQYEKKKLIWFIMTVLEEIEKGKSLDKNISYLQNKNRKGEEPKIIKYKGDKVVARDKMGAKNLYYNNPAAATTVRERSVSVNANGNTFSPLKINFKPNKTPLKNNTNNQTPNKILSKSPLKSNSPTQQKRVTNNYTPTKDRSTNILNNDGSTAKRNFRF